MIEHWNIQDNWKELEYLGTWTELEGQLGTQKLNTVEHVGYSHTWVLRYLGAWALKTLRHLATQSTLFKRLIYDVLIEVFRHM